MFIIRLYAEISVSHRFLYGLSIYTAPITCCNLCTISDIVIETRSEIVFVFDITGRV